MLNHANKHVRIRLEALAQAANHADIWFALAG